MKGSINPIKGGLDGEGGRDNATTCLQKCAQQFRVRHPGSPGSAFEPGSRAGVQGAF